jgi:GT2 family glycosyltransferase
MRPSLGIVIVNHNEGDRLLATVRSLVATAPPATEFVVVDDASSDGSADAVEAQVDGVTVVRLSERVGNARARNIGARQLKTDILVQADGHVAASDGWFDGFEPLLERDEVGIVGPTCTVMGDERLRGYGRTIQDGTLSGGWLPYAGSEPYSVPMLGGFFMALRREVFEQVAGFDEGLIQWGATDLEFSQRVWELGYECVIAPSVLVAHAFRSRFPYSVDVDAPLHNRLRYATIHFSGPRLESILGVLMQRSNYPRAARMVVESDAGQRRELHHLHRVRDDQWFCERFDIALEREAAAAGLIADTRDGPGAGVTP